VDRTNTNREPKCLSPIHSPLNPKASSRRWLSDLTPEGQPNDGLVRAGGRVHRERRATRHWLSRDRCPTRSRISSTACRWRPRRATCWLPAISPRSCWTGQLMAQVPTASTRTSKAPQAMSCAAARMDSAPGGCESVRYVRGWWTYRRDGAGSVNTISTPRTSSLRAGMSPILSPCATPVSNDRWPASSRRWRQPERPLLKAAIPRAWPTPPGTRLRREVAEPRQDLAHGHAAIRAVPSRSGLVRPSFMYRDATDKALGGEAAGRVGAIPSSRLVPHQAMFAL
jgi:hypothetical protein